jgi:superfamily I DNA/RNA helicase
VNSTWWRKLDDLDEAQKTFIQLAPQGRFLLDGPPGSGKTNLLLLRAQFVAGSGDKNVLIVTYTNVLADFIRSGIALKNLISPSQIRTFHSWAVEHVGQYLGWKAVPIKKNDFDEKARAKLVEAVLKANKKAPSKGNYIVGKLADGRYNREHVNRRRAEEADGGNRRKPTEARSYRHRRPWNPGAARPD